MKTPWILPVAALAIGAAGGYISGKNTSDGGATATVTEQTTARGRASSRGTLKGAANDPTKSARNSSTEQIARMPGNTSRVQALLEFYSSLSAEQLAEEATKLDGLPMNERMTASFLLFGRWAEVDPQAAMAFSQSMGMAGNFVRPTILQSWASVDPAGAAKFYQDNPREFATMGMFGRGGGGGQESGASIIASEWARQDPAGALAWAAGLTTDKGQAMTSVIGEVAKTDPRKAADMISQMDAADRANAYRTVASQYGALDFQEAQAWVRTLPAAEQANALASAIGGLSNSDPAAAAVQVASMEDGEVKDRLIPEVVGDLARRDARAASEFLKKQTSEDAQRDGMRQLMPVWTSQNPQESLDFAYSFSGEVRDSALQSWVMNNNTTPPKDVIAVAKTIENDRDRNRSIAVPVMKWMREDPEEARAYVETSTDISDEMKSRLEGAGRNRRTRN